MANQNKIPRFKSAITLEKLKGIITQTIKLKNKLKHGANKKIKVYALVGIIISFKISFIASAKGCNNPQKPVTLGPSLL
jgi:hypothetical protein